MKNEFVIPYPAASKARSQWSKRFGLNGFWAGKPWQQRKKDADTWHRIVWAELAKQDIPRGKTFPYPVRIRFWFNDRLDIDNDSIYVKLTIDALKGWMIEDDNKKYVKSVEMNCHEENYILVRLERY